MRRTVFLYVYPLIALAAAALIAVLASFLRIVAISSETMTIILLSILVVVFAEHVVLLQNIGHRLDHLEFRLDPRLTAQSRLLARMPLDRLITANCDLILVGASAKSLVAKNGHLFKRARSVQVILMNPEFESAASTYFNLTGANIKLEVPATERELQAAKNLAVRYANFYPPFTLLGVNVSTPEGAIIVTYRGYGIEVHNRPSLLLTRFDNPEWFEDYVHQFQKLWQDCDPGGESRLESPTS